MLQILKVLTLLIEPIYTRSLPLDLTGIHLSLTSSADLFKPKNGGRKKTHKSTGYSLHLGHTICQREVTTIMNHRRRNRRGGSGAWLFCLRGPVWLWPPCRPIYTVRHALQDCMLPHRVAPLISLPFPTSPLDMQTAKPTLVQCDT